MPRICHLQHAHSPAHTLMPESLHCPRQGCSTPSATHQPLPHQPKAGLQPSARLPSSAVTPRVNSRTGEMSVISSPMQNRRKLFKHLFLKKPNWPSAQMPFRSHRQGSRVTYSKVCISNCATGFQGTGLQLLLQGSQGSSTAAPAEPFLLQKESSFQSAQQAQEQPAGCLTPT